MATSARPPPRIFKTAWFSKAASKAHITDDELYVAARQAMLGQADDLGGGVFKKRLNENMHRALILAKGGQYCVYEYLFAKKDRENIDAEELTQLRKLAKSYKNLTDRQIVRLLQDKDFSEICHDGETQV